MSRFAFALLMAMLCASAEDASADCSMQSLTEALSPARPDLTLVSKIVAECDEKHAMTPELIAKLNSRGEEFFHYGYFDLAQALYKIAADHGYAQAQSNLGYLYHNFVGVGHDDVEAVRLFRLSAAAGNADGEANLARMYELGAGGLPKSDADADRLYRSAAAKWNKFAIERLRMRTPPKVADPAPESLGNSLTVAVEYAKVREEWQNAAASTDEPLLTIPLTIVDAQKEAGVLGQAPGNVLLQRTPANTFVLSLLDEPRGIRYDFDVGSKTGVTRPSVSGDCSDSAIAQITDTANQRVVTVALFARDSNCLMRFPVGPANGMPGLNSAPPRSIDIEIKSTLQDATLQIVGSHFAPMKLPQTLDLTGHMDINNEADTYRYVVIQKPGYFDATFALYCQWDQSGGGVLSVNKQQFRFSRRSRKISLPPITLRPMS